MRAPDFWWLPTPTLAARLLAPAGSIYGAVTAARMRCAGVRAPVAVICIGNLVAGGAGKTPVALAIARMLEAGGHRPAFLSRGYGRQQQRNARDVLRVDPDRHGAAFCGDEPLLLAQLAPTYVSADRLAAARVAAREGATVVVLDDGLQNPALTKDFSIAVADGRAGIGNGLCLPAGPLRAPAARQWPFVSLLCIVGEGAAAHELAERARMAGVPVTSARLEPDAAVVTRLKDRPLLAFAGIGRPQKLFDTLAASGLAVVAQRAFPDHHAYTAHDLAALRRDADRAGAVLVTTAKDGVRLPPDFPAETLPVELVFDDPARVAARLATVMER